MKLRVAHILNSPGFGGVPRVADALIRHADRNRIDPSIFYLKGDPPDGAAAATGAGGKTGTVADLAEWLDANRIDILHTHSFRPNLYGRMAGALLRPGLRIVAHYHNDYSDKWSDPQVISLERRLAQHTDAAFAVSDFVACHVRDRTGLPESSVRTVLNGIDEERLANAHRERGRHDLGLASTDLAIGLVGRVCNQKGIDTFVEAALRLAGRAANLQFRVIGDIEDACLKERLVRQVACSGLSGRIRFTGHIDRIADALAALDILAAPSRWEGFGLALVEAMLLGLPVVASDRGAIPEIAGDAARLIPAEDPARLAEALAELADCEGARRDLARRGRERASQFSWENAARQVEGVYFDIMDAGV